MTSLITADRAANAVVEQEKLSDGTIVWVARDLTWDGCLAQGASREAALAALEYARQDYAAVLGELNQAAGQPAPVKAVSGWADRMPASTYTFLS